MKIIENYNLKTHNTFGFDVVAKKFVEYENEYELIEFLRQNSLAVDERNRNVEGQGWLHIGGGSNLLFLGDFDGTILHSAIKFIALPQKSGGSSPLSVTEQSDAFSLSKCRSAGELDGIFVRVGAGVVWDDFVAEMVENGFGGVENLSLIPGEVGAAAVQNIGAYGIEIQNIIAKVEAIEVATLQKRIFDVSECKYGYRESIFKTDLKGKFIITAVIFHLSKSPILKLDYGAIKEHLKNIQTPNIQNVREAIIEIRQSKLPDTKILGNAGSFFKNPYCSKEHFEELQKKYPNIPLYPVVNSGEKEIVKLSAAWLIEQCGWKGKTLGGAAVYHLQPLVIVNKGNAKPQDVSNLSAEIQKSVKEKFDLELETEVNFI